MVDTNRSKLILLHFLAAFLATGLLAVAFLAAAFFAAGLLPAFLVGLAGLLPGFAAEPFAAFLVAGLLTALSTGFLATFFVLTSSPLALLVEPFFTFFGVTFLTSLASAVFLGTFFGASVFFFTTSLDFSDVTFAIL